MIVLIGCEESQTTCKAFRALGHEAYSCDLQDCSGGHPEWHLKMDVFEAIALIKPKLFIGHPPCTFLSNAAAWCFNIEKLGNKALDRWVNRIEAARFFMRMWEQDIEYICLENPIGFFNNDLGFRPHQIVQPFQFGDSQIKTTCLWLKNLPQLKHIAQTDLFDTKTHVAKPKPIYHRKSDGKAIHFTEANHGSFDRSKSFPGISNAMAEQWSIYIEERVLNTAIAV